MKGLRQDLINFIGHRIVAAMKNIKPKLLSDVCTKDEEICAEQEAVYLQGLTDGVMLATILPIERCGETCFKENGSSHEE